MISYKNKKYNCPLEMTIDLIGGKIFPQVPPKVEYMLTDFGRTLMPVLKEINKWGTEYADSKEREGNL